jgi:hypothetical protein
MLFINFDINTNVHFVLKPYTGRVISPVINICDNSVKDVEDFSVGVVDVNVGQSLSAKRSLAAVFDGNDGGGSTSSKVTKQLPS